MKILQSYKVYRPDVDGGIPFVMAALCRLSSDGVTNEILVARHAGKGRRYEFDRTPVEAVSSLGTMFSTPLAPTFPFVLAQRARQADIVVLHAPFPLADLASTCFPDDVGLIIYWHAEIAGYPLLRKLVSPVIRYALQRADRIVVADSTTISTSSILSDYADKCSIVPYGIDVSFWAKLAASDRVAVKALQERYPAMVLAIGRLVPYKGLDVLVRAAKELEAQIVIIGEGPLENELKQMAAREGVADRVIFRGRIPQEEIKTYIHAAKVLAFPSVTIAEAFGIVQVEAMAAGLPIVNTNLPTAVPVVARHEKEALTVEVGNASALATAIRRILDEPALARQLGESGRHRARSEYDYEQFLARMKVVYDEVALSPRSRPNSR